jgi:mRNA-degrading endonuclease RelE of RelBE toxin-antitoxin system
MNLILLKEAESDFKHLPKTEKKKIFKKLKFLENKPFSGKCLAGKLKGLRSLRAWPYRILYEISQSAILVHRILHRQGAYK